MWIEQVLLEYVLKGFMFYHKGKLPLWAKHNKVVKLEYVYQDLCFYYKGKLLLWAKNNKVLTLNCRALHLVGLV